MMGIANAQNDGADGFRGYLEAIGFRVIQLKLKNQPSMMDEMVNEPGPALLMTNSDAADDCPTETPLKLADEGVTEIAGSS